MKKYIGDFFVACVALWLTSMILGPRMEFADFGSIVMAAIFIGLLYFILTPILNIITSPVFLFLSRFLVSDLILIVLRESEGQLYIASYWWAVLAAVIISLLTSVIYKVAGMK